IHKAERMADKNRQRGVTERRNRCTEIAALDTALRKVFQLRGKRIPKACIKAPPLNENQFHYTPAYEAIERVIKRGACAAITSISRSMSPALCTALSEIRKRLALRGTVGGRIAGVN